MNLVSDGDAACALSAHNASGGLWPVFAVPTSPQAHKLTSPHPMPDGWIKLYYWTATSVYTTSACCWQTLQAMRGAYPAFDCRALTVRDAVQRKHFRYHKRQVPTTPLTSNECLQPLCHSPRLELLLDNHGSTQLAQACTRSRAHMRHSSKQRPQLVEHRPRCCRRGSCVCFCSIAGPVHVVVCADGCCCCCAALAAAASIGLACFRCFVKQQGRGPVRQGVLQAGR
jgi:hypothetical protein